MYEKPYIPTIDDSMRTIVPTDFANEYVPGMS